LNKEVIEIAKGLELLPITLDDAAELLQLMQRIYPPPYAHIWDDYGAWYVQHTYNPKQLALELAQPHCPYYFVRFQNRHIGILRLCHGLEFPGKPGLPATKLHRIYLDGAIHGQGIGKRLMAWSKKVAQEQGHTLLWLEAMEVQSGARSFYEKLGYVQEGRLILPFKRLSPGKAGLLQYYLEF
jgi:GNAT superfamily N-acetyltransferase